MGRDEILQILRNYKQSHKLRYGIKAIGLFGSISRGIFNDNCDVDIFVELENPDLFVLADIKEDVEQCLCRPVDIVRLRENMNSFLKQRIVRDGIYV